MADKFTLHTATARASCEELQKLEEAAAMVRPSELLRFVAEAQYTVGSAAGFESH